MDEGIRLGADEITKWMERNGENLGWFNQCFEYEEDGWTVRILNLKTSATKALKMLQHFGYGSDLRPLVEDKRINMDFREKLNCDSCGKNGGVVHAGRSIGFSLCYTCLCEMVIFYEMEKEKREIGTGKVQEVMQLTGPDYLYGPDKRGVRDQRFP